LAERFAAFLADAGIARGLLGPREVPRLWDRHLLNCAVVTDLVPAQARIVDVGSGAGLPGLVLAIRRADLRVDLVDSQRRRTDFLTEAVELLGLGGQVRVVPGRAEDAAVVEQVGRARWATARAVAPLDRLVGWCLPLLQPGGCLLAIKGGTAADELRRHAGAIRRAGGREPAVVTCGAELSEQVSVVRVVRAQPISPRKGKR
jgi:16S rRNA (guanine527-N7)-methyltransferase